MKLNGKSAPNFGFQLTREVSTGIGHARPVGDLFDTSRDFTLTPLGERRYRYLPTATSDVHSMKLRSDEIRRPFKVYLLSKIKAAFGLRPRPARAK